MAGPTRRAAVEEPGNRFRVWLALLVSSVCPGCQSSHGEASSDGGLDRTTPADGAAMGVCPVAEPAEGTTCAVPGLACGGFGSFSCPETAICAAERRWGITCPEFVFGVDSAVCGCPHPGGVGVTISFDASVSSGAGGSSDAQSPSDEPTGDRSSCRWPADAAVDSYVPQPGACTAGPMFRLCTVPNGGTVEADGTIVAPDGAVVTGTCQDACTPDQYTLTCQAAGLSAAIPAPDPSLGCSAIPDPTPSNLLDYCCPCTR